MKSALKALLAVAGSITLISAVMAQDAPAPGKSPRIDAIKKAGILRVGVLANAPWLIENTTNGGEHWSGPAWDLAKEYAKRLNVKLEPVLVSHETKVPVLASNQVDISITALAETPERIAVVDFILYSNTSVCMFGRADNPKFAKAQTVDDLNTPDVTIAYFIGSAEEGWVQKRSPNAKFLGVANSGATAPLEDVMAKRADAAPINRIPYVPMARCRRTTTARAAPKRRSRSGSLSTRSSRNSCNGPKRSKNRFIRNSSPPSRKSSRR